MAELSFDLGENTTVIIKAYDTGIAVHLIVDGMTKERYLLGLVDINTFSEIAKHGEKLALDSQLKKAGELATQTADTLKSVLQHMPNASREEIKAKIKEVIQPKEIALAVINGHLDAAIKGGKCSCGAPGEPMHTCPYKSDIHNDNDTLCNCCKSCARECAMEIK